MSHNFVILNGETYYLENDTLDFSCKNIDDITDIWGIGNLKNLRKLDLSGNRIKEIRGLENLTNLRYLNLCDNLIEKIRGLENLTNLQYLDLHFNRIKDIRGLEHLINLLHLDLRKNQIEEINGLENLTNLQELDLNDNPIKTDEEYLIEKSVQEIVRYCQTKVVTIKGTKYYVKDNTLDLSKSGIRSIIEIEGLENLSTLKKLKLKDNQIKEIRGLQYLSELEELDLNDNQIKEIDGLEHFKNLKKLYLRNNQIKELRRLEHLTNLQHLDLRENPIRSVRERHLIEMNAQAIVRYCQEKRETRKERIVQDQKILLGKPIIKGTRISVEFLLELLANEWTYEEILENYPQLDKEDILAALEYSMKLLKLEEVYFLE